MDAGHDENGKATIICASSLDGITIVPIKINPANHGLKVDDNTTGSDNGNNNGNAVIDSNEVAGWLAESSAGDGSLIEVYGDESTGKVLIDSA